MYKNELLSKITQYLEGKEFESTHKLLEFIFSFSFPNQSNEIADFVEQKAFFQGGILSTDLSQISYSDFPDEITSYIKALFSFAEIYSQLKSENRLLSSHKSAGDFLVNLFGKQEVEILYLICLTEDNHIISANKMAHGDKGRVLVETDILIKKALDEKAKNVIVAHNHPSSYMRYSMEDYYATEKLSAYFKKEGITLLEHFVIGANGYNGIMKDLQSIDMWKR